MKYLLRTIQADWRKLRRPTLLLGTLGAVMGVSALAASIQFIMLNQQRRSRRESMFTTAMLENSHGLASGLANAAGLLGVVALAVFAAQTANEYTNGTLRNLLVRQPRRLVLLSGKALAMAIFSLLVVLTSAFTTIVASYIWAAAKSIDTSAWTTSEGLSYLVNVFGNIYLATIGYGIFGMMLGLIFRSPISAISIGLAWTMIVEGIVSAVWDWTAKYLPGQLLSAIGSGGNPIIDYSTALPRGLIFLALFVGIGALLFKKRDVGT